MNLITVIPLTRSKIAESLSYFTSSNVAVGAIVSVPLRTKTIHAVVVDEKPVVDVKSQIKTAPFEIRRAGKVKVNAFFPSYYINVCKHLADYYATNVGAIMYSSILDTLLQNANKIELPVKTEIDSATSQAISIQVKNQQIFAIQANDDDRVSAWRSLIRQEFAKKKSVVFYLPTIEDVDAFYSVLQKGIEGYIFRLNTALTKKQLLDTWQKIATTDHSIVIVATGQFSLLPRADIESVVIERENNRGWISQKTPYLDSRKLLEDLTVSQNRVLYLSDCLLRIETLERLEKNEIEYGSPFKWRSISDAKDWLIDMVRKNIKTHNIGSQQPSFEIEDQNEASYSKTNDSKNANAFRVLSPELEKIIEINRRESTHMMIYVVRRGFSAVTACDDCETIVSCLNCSAPVVLHVSRDSGKNFFMCHKCGEILDADITCRHCGGFRLTSLGIGIERIEQAIKDKFPDQEIFKIDADSVKNEKHASAIIEKYRDRPGSILLGTEMALARMRDKVDYVAIISLDSLLALPDFRMTEKIMYLLTRLRQIAIRSLIVQSRRPNEKVFEYGIKGNLNDYYKNLIDERRQFHYPPYSTLIKIAVEGKKDAIAQVMAEIRKIIAPVEIDIFPAFTSTIRGNSIIHGLIKIQSHQWPSFELLNKLRSLPPSVSVRVDPESLL